MSDGVGHATVGVVAIEKCQAVARSLLWPASTPTLLTANAVLLALLPGSGSTMPAACVHTNARVPPLPAVVLYPTTTPRSSIAVAALVWPPSVPRSTRPPVELQTKACVSNTPLFAASGVVLEPITIPALLTATAWLELPPNDPRSIIPPDCVHTNARLSTSPAVVLRPTTTPASLTEIAALLLPASVP